MKKLIQTSLEQAISYEDYRIITAKLVSEEKTSGPNQTESLIFYTKLNNQRMNRLDKTLELSPEIIEKANAISCNLNWLVLTESWCGDAAQILPVLNKIAAASGKISMSLLFRDDNLELMDHFLTNGGRSIPKLIVVDQSSLEVKGAWGPRPKPAQDMFQVYKAKKDEIPFKDFQTELQTWYLKDKAKTIQEELLEFLDICQ